MDLIKTFQFEAAHRTAHGLHGHSYLVEVRVRGECDPDHGWVMDYGDIKYRFKPLFKQLDHYLLNEVEAMDDVSVEGVRNWIEERLRNDIDMLFDVHVSIIGDGKYQPVRLEADERFGVGPRIAFTFEAAHNLPTLPETHKCRRMHGHSFSVQVGADDLDQLERDLEKLYGELNHSCLNDIPGLQNATSEKLAKWIWGWCRINGPAPTVVIIAETCTARCQYFGD